jgi:hypothetical protein
MIFSLRWAGILWVSALFLFSCDRFTPIPHSAPKYEESVPSRNEIYVFRHGRLEMSAFEALRANFPDLSPNSVVRLAQGSQWLETKLQTGRSATREETTRCVRAVLEPRVSPEAFRRAAAFATSHFGFATLDLLRQSLDDAAAGWVVEWNPTLVREYGISISNR